MSALDFFIVCVFVADYLIAVPAFLSSSQTPLILLGVALVIAPIFIAYCRFFKE